jgi:multiple sugar transport system substrate-binding protein
MLGRRLRNLAGAAVATLTLLVTACGGGGGSSAASPSQSSLAGTTLNLLLENHPWQRAIQPYFADFEKQTGIHLQTQVLSEEQARNKTLITLQSHSPAIDVFMSLPSLEGTKYNQAGYYQPLDSYVHNGSLTPSSYNFSDFQKGPLDGEKEDGKLIGIPILVEGPVLYYRKDLFQQYGVGPPKSLDDLVQAAKTIYEKSGHKYVVATRGLSTSIAYTFGVFFHNQGLQWVDKSGQPNFDKKGAVNAIQQYATLAKDYGPQGVVNNNFTQSSALMAQGHASMEIDSTNEISDVVGPSSTVSDKLGIMPLPAGPGGSHPTVLQWGVSMSAFSQHKDAAWKFIQWATSPEMQLKLALKGIASPRVSTGKSADYQKTLDSPLRKQWQQTLDTILANGNPQVGPPAPNQPQARKVIGDAIDEVILGQQSAQQAAQAIQAGLKPLVTKGG